MQMWAEDCTHRLVLFWGVDIMLCHNAIHSCNKHQRKKKGRPAISPCGWSLKTPFILLKRKKMPQPFSCSLLLFVFTHRINNLGAMPTFPEDDEENLLYTTNPPPPNYGCITSSPLSHPQRAHRSNEDSSSRGSSDVDDTCSSRIAKRKQKRLQQRHRPKLSSRLSTVIRATTSTDSASGHYVEEEEEEDTPELVLPALDPK